MVCKPMVDDATDSIGDTSLIKLKSITKGLEANIAVKMEYSNPTASVKDRAARNMIEEAERAGKLVPGQSVIIEGTSGNMGIALAAICAMKGYKCVIVMPSSMSVERRAAIKAYGAELILTDPVIGHAGLMERLDLLAEIIPNSFKTDQFNNPANPGAHYKTTGPEIWEQTNGKVDIVCFGVGTAGTITGTGKFLREKKPEIGIYAVEPFESSVLSGFPRGVHKIQGIGAGVVPAVLDRSLLDDVMRCPSDDAILMSRRLATEEGILGGISSGANVWAAVELAKKPENKGKLIVTTVNSFGERYLSTPLYEEIRKEVSALNFMSLEESKIIVEKYLASS